MRNENINGTKAYVPARSGGGIGECGKKRGGKKKRFHFFIARET